MEILQERRIGVQRVRQIGNQREIAMSGRYGVGEERLVHYTCHRVPTTIDVDGNLDKDVWTEAPRSRRFVDLVTGDPAFWTREWPRSGTSRHSMWVSG